MADRKDIPVTACHVWYWSDARWTAFWRRQHALDTKIQRVRREKRVKERDPQKGKE